MPELEVMTLWPQSATSLAIALGVALVVLYLARRPAHDLLLGVSRGGHNLLRLAARGLLRTEQRVVRRTRDVMLTIARDLQERSIEREFQRVNTAVKRDLSTYPTLHRELGDQIRRVDEDYQRSAEVPPMPPAWLDAVSAVAQIPASNDPAVARILEDMHATLESSSHQALMEYRSASRRRLHGLRRMLPYWRRLDSTLEQVNRTVQTLERRADNIDQQMDRYRQLREDTDQSARALASSSFTQFLTGSLVLTIAVLAAIFNYQLLLPGMSTLTDGYIGSVANASLAAGFITLLQIGMGLVILESLRVTRMLPLIGGLDDMARTRLLTAASGVLLALTVLEASLAFTTAQQLALLGGETTWASSLALLILGTVLPLVLAFVAIPLEGFINSSRAVVGLLLAQLLRTLALTLRLLGGALRGAGKLAVQGYDLLIFLPLWVEAKLQRSPRPAKAVPAQPAAQPAAAGPGTQPMTQDKQPPRPRSSERKVKADAEAEVEAG